MATRKSQREAAEALRRAQEARDKQVRLQAGGILEQMQSIVCDDYVDQGFVSKLMSKVLSQIVIDLLKHNVDHMKRHYPDRDYPDIDSIQTALQEYVDVDLTDGEPSPVTIGDYARSVYPRYAATVEKEEQTKREAANKKRRATKNKVSA